MDIKEVRKELKNGKTIYDLPLRVGYYARVSTDKDDQLNSLDNQRKYFEELISENKNWTLVNGYIDEGLSGTEVKKRESFLKMINDSTNGTLDLILTKEISRFSRNTVDSIKYTQYLLKQGTVVYFLSDNLNTIQEDSEFRLTIMSSLAQDEVRKLSERVKFGINRMIKDRKLIGGKLIGYDKKNGVFTINEHEAKMVKYVFNVFSSGKKGLTGIARDLKEMGYLNSKGQIYSTTSLAKIIINPRFKGYYTARMTEVEDYKTHKKVDVAKENQIIEKDDRIPAIVTEEIWDKANEIYEKRKKKPAKTVLSTNEHLEKYKYTSKLVCGDCGNTFVRNGGSNRSHNPVWNCNTYRTKGLKSCASAVILEKALDKIMYSLFTDIIEQKKEIIENIKDDYKKVLERDSIFVNKDEFLNNKSKLINRRNKLLELYSDDLITKKQFKEDNENLTRQIEEIEGKLEEYNKIKKEEDFLSKKLKVLDEILPSKINVLENLPFLVQLLIDRIEVHKINGNRKNLHLKIFFDFDNLPCEIKVDFDNNKHNLESLAFQKVDKNNSFLTLECSSSYQKESRIC